MTINLHVSIIEYCYWDFRWQLILLLLISQLKQKKGLWCYSIDVQFKRSRELEIIHQLPKIFLQTFTIVLLQSLSKGCQWAVEAEHGNTNGTIIQRDGMSNKLTVRLSEDQYIIWGIVTESPCILQILNMVYMNDGLSDTCNITVYVNGGKLVGSFDTRSQSHLPISSGLIGDTVLSSGDHTIKLTATNMNERGIEVDRMILGLLCTNGMSTSEGCPNLQEQTTQEPDNTISNHDSWDKKLIIGLVFEIFIAIIEVILLATTFVTIYIRCRRIKNGNNDDSCKVASVKFRVNNEEVQIPLLRQNNNNIIINELQLAEDAMRTI